jgi:hypothetical protein
VVAIVSASLRYLRGTLVFERWREAPLSALSDAPAGPPPRAGARAGASTRARAPVAGDRDPEEV